MARAIRQIGLKIVIAAWRLTQRAAPPGWRRSRRSLTLRGR
jgi:hypothetical protein